jgi:prevent-host-death family protein
MKDTETTWTVRSDELRRNLRHLLESVEHEDAHVVIKRYDKPAAVIVPIGWYREVCSLVADIGEWLIPAMEDLDRLGEWQHKANAVRRDLFVEGPA